MGSSPTAGTSLWQLDKREKRNGYYAFKYFSATFYKGNMMQTKEQVLSQWFGLYDLIPVDWNNKESISSFKNASNFYSKSWSKLSYSDQGWVSEQINGRVQ